VRDATTGVGAISVVIAWHPPAADGVSRSEARRTVPADRDGTFALCGIPDQQAVTISATGRTGIVKDSTGRPLEDARITISGVAGEWRTNYDGVFVARGIPAGTHAAESRALGFEPDQRIVDLASTDSSHLDLSMSRLITKLSAVTMREHEHFNEIKAELDQRRRAGFGYRTDSLELKHLPDLSDAFVFPGVHVDWKPTGWKVFMRGVKSITRTNGNQELCAANVYIDGQSAVYSGKSLTEMHKEEVALIEMFNTAARAPLQFPSDNNCGVVLVWTKMYVNPPR